MSDLRTILFLAFFALGALEAVLAQRLYLAMQRREPAQYEDQYAWVGRVQARPTRLFSEVAAATRERLGLILHSSPYPEVERIRRYLLVALVFIAAAFVALLFVR